VKEGSFAAVHRSGSNSGGELVVEALLESARVETLAVDQDDAAAVGHVGSPVSDVVKAEGPDHGDALEVSLPELLWILRECGLEDAEGGRPERHVEGFDRGVDRGLGPAPGEEVPILGKVHEGLRRRDRR
jgi:hypothetical protein